MLRLGGRVISTENASNFSSVSLGETLEDTIRVVDDYVDVIVLRHNEIGGAKRAASVSTCPVINAGDGKGGQHPTQALLDLYTLRERHGRLEGLKVVIIGDIAHSRVARSNIIGLRTMGASVTICGPSTLIPIGYDAFGVEAVYDVDQAIEDVDVIYVLRIQLERQTSGLFPTLREYHRSFGITKERLKAAKKEVTIMHPGPINRGIELTSDVADGEHSVILDQVLNGVAVRMAVLYLLTGEERALE
jgi:aspartate carbamoyltransferase catalytic subunit